MGFRGGKLAMADIALSELAMLRRYAFFGSVHAMHTLRRCVTASNRSRFGLLRAVSIISMAEAGEPDLP